MGEREGNLEAGRGQEEGILGTGIVGRWGWAGRVRAVRVLCNLGKQASLGGEGGGEGGGSAAAIPVRVFCSLCRLAALSKRPRSEMMMSSKRGRLLGSSCQQSCMSWRYSSIPGRG